MDLRKLEAFLTVANTGKYTDAADGFVKLSV